MMISQDALDDALDKIDDGLELHLSRSRAWWQLRGRAAIRFPIEANRARRIIDALSDRFLTRRPPAKTILTTEPVPVDDDHEQDDDGPSLILKRRWVIAQEIADAMGMSKGYVARKLKVHEHRMEWRWAVQEGRRSRWKAYDAYDVVLVVEDVFDLTLTVYEGVKSGPKITPKSVVLTRPWYSFKTLAPVVNRRASGIQTAIRQSDVELTSELRKVEHSYRRARVFRTDARLVRFLKERWDIDATIRTGVREAG